MLAGALFSFFILAKSSPFSSDCFTSSFALRLPLQSPIRILLDATKHALSLSSGLPVHPGDPSDVSGQPYGLGAGVGALARSGGTPGRSPQPFGDPSMLEPTRSTMMLMLASTHPSAHSKTSTREVGSNWVRSPVFTFMISVIGISEFKARVLIVCLC